MLTDKKSGQKILRSIFNPTHHFVLLCLDFLAVRMAFVRKHCGGKYGRSVLVDSSPKLIFGTMRYGIARTLSKMVAEMSSITNGGRPYYTNRLITY